jgi:ACS family tartrate transporter-like MFS transporter
MSEHRAGSAPVTPLAEGLRQELVMWKVSVRLIPFLFVLYVVNILDRGNVGFARRQMLPALGLGESVYGLAGGLFALGYFIFEVPSNLILKRTGARVWIGRIMITWGLISAAMMFIRGPWSFYLLRFLLGVAEAGFFPGIILYLSYWFPARERARAVSRFMTGSAVAGIVGSPLSGAILDYLDGVAGLAGWQWVFLVEGLPAVVLGVLALYYLTDRPAQAQWLAPAERAWLSERLSREERHRETRYGVKLLHAMASGRVWLLCVVYFTVSMGAYGFGLYAPKIVGDHFTRASELQVGLLVALPSVAAIVGMVAVGALSDYSGERRWHVAVSALVAAAGWLMVAALDDPWLVLTGLALAHTGALSMLAPFWSLPTSFLSGAAAAGGIALINSVGNLGGFVAPAVIGQVKETTGSFTYAFLFLAAALVGGGLLALRAHHDSTEDSPPRRQGRQEETEE